MQLTECQDKAAKTFLAFLVSPNKHMCISGPPGVGKTHMLDHMIDMLPNTERICNIMGAEPLVDIKLTATTNKAAEVLQERFPNRDVTTIHSCLGLTVRDDYRTGKTNTVKGKNFSYLQDTLLLMDEASMADTQLLKLIEEATNRNCKIVFIGDHCQLAPVSEKESPAFNSGFLTSYLTTQVRTSNSPDLTALNTQLRETVETGVFKPISPVPGVIDFVDDETFRSLMDAHFINQETPGHKILAYTNKRTQEFNSYIREQKGLPPHLIVGDTVISNNSIEVGSSRTKIEKEYRVTQVSNSINTDSKVGIQFRTVVLNGNLHVWVAENYSQLAGSIREAARIKDWETYFYLKNNFADLRIAYAGTAHKSQGSTYHTVYIDLSDLRVCRDPQELARLLYVATSRATTRVVFYGSL
jgi:ATP-dependent exoDNAse (exonuclease V) alpha subunit